MTAHDQATNGLHRLNFLIEELQISLINGNARLQKSIRRGAIPQWQGGEVEL